MSGAITLDQPYFERADPRENRFDAMLTRGRFWLHRRMTPLRRRSLRAFAIATEKESVKISDLSDAALKGTATTLRGRLLREGLSLPTAITAFALAREACARQIALRHFRVQIQGGAAMLRRSLAEMETGEGKTITALLPAAAFALAGRRVHVVTVNDYLATRDAEQLGPVYAALGLSVGLIVHGQSPAERRAAYGCDVTYCTNKDLVFDYLRDRITLGRRRSRSRLLLDGLVQGGRLPDRLLLRGLDVAIVDEADSVLIDEARTPLILSSGGDADEPGEVFAEALDLARRLDEGDHWCFSPHSRSIELTADGRSSLTQMAEGHTGLWAVRRAREELAERALSALHRYHRDVQYIIADGKVQIVDEFTGRVMPDRTWEFGLHQMIEAKEGCKITGRRQTLARITYQRFFRRYRHLAGMTGTATEVAGELATVYGLGVTRITTNRPLRRASMGARLFGSADARWARVVRSTQEIVGARRAVLIGTRSVEASEHISRLLETANLPHRVLNARDDRQEAEIVAAAGQPGRITVATNMAGRGTDIRLERNVREAGGLHVILTEYHEDARIDRQLFGRSGRQGDAGSYEAVASLDDELFSRFLSPALRALATRAVGSNGEVPLALARPLIRRAQGAAERSNAITRQQTLASDLKLDDLLAFAGQGE
jgi:preprotein translocase subunit SecA